MTDTPRGSSSSLANDVSGWGDAPEVLRGLTTEEAVNAKCQEIFGAEPAGVAPDFGYNAGPGIVEGYSWPKYPRSDYVAFGCAIPIEPSGDLIALPIGFHWSADPNWPPQSDALANDPASGFFVPAGCVKVSIIQSVLKPEWKSRVIEKLQRAGEKLCD